MNAYHIVVCGQSLFLEAIIEGLRRESALHISRVKPHQRDALAQIVALAPDAVLMEAQAQHSDFAFAVLQAGLPLIGLSAEESLVTVLEGRRLSARSLAELAQILENVGRQKDGAAARIVVTAAAL